MKCFANTSIRRSFFYLGIIAAAAGPLAVGTYSPPGRAGEARIVGQAAAAAEAAPIDTKGIESITHRVYRLLVETESGAVKGGTAFLVSGRRILATNNHVVEGGTAYSLGFVGDDGHVRRVPARVIATYSQKDLALLEALDELPGEPLQLSTDYPGPASDLFAIGFPAAADPQGVQSWTQGDDETYFLPSVLRGYVSRVLTNRWFSSQLQHQTPIIPGYSGGPLIDDHGAVVAISSSIHKEAKGVSYGVMALDLADFLSACSLPIHVANANYRPAIRIGKPVAMPQAVETSSVQTKTVSTPQDLTMLARANDFLERGDIIAARLMFDYLIKNSGIAEAYSGLAKTYDPIFLNDKNVIGVSGDAAKAREFYEKAAEGGGKPMQKRSPALRPAAARTEGCDGSVCRLVNDPKGPLVACEQQEAILNAAGADHQ